MVSLVCESDNSYVAYIVKRLCDDHGPEGENTSIMLSNFAGGYSGAISDMGNDAYM